MYHDAYTLQKVEPEHLSSFNFAAGMVPFLLNLIQDVSSLIDHRLHAYRLGQKRTVFESSINYQLKT